MQTQIVVTHRYRHRSSNKKSGKLKPTKRVIAKLKI